jgi:Zn finger protein HypA/HybF involved in hydrogenase expression
MPKKLSTIQFIERAIKVHGNKYNYSLSEYKDANSKIIIICSLHGNFEQKANHHMSGHGCPSCSGNKNKTTEEFINESNLLYNNKFDYTKTIYTNASSKIIIICKQHGYFEQTPDHHLRGQGCPNCSGNVRLTTEEFIERSTTVHNNKYDYSLVDYKNGETKVKIICTIHGEFEQKASNHLSGKGCPKCRSSKGELLIDHILKERGIKFETQWSDDGKCRHKSALKFDFYIPSINTAIEYDGEQHFMPRDVFGGDEEFQSTQLRDQIKTKYCLDNGIRLVRIPYTMAVDVIKETVNNLCK